MSTGAPFDFLNNNPQLAREGGNNDLVRLLLSEIVRVRELIAHYESIPNGNGHLGATILTELVTEAYNSLVNYDTELIAKYYDLLKHCD